MAEEPPPFYFFQPDTSQTPYFEFLERFKIVTIEVVIRTTITPQLKSIKDIP